MLTTEIFAELTAKGQEKSWNTHPTEEGLISHFEAIRTIYQNLVREDTGETHGTLHIPESKRIILVPDDNPYVYTPHSPNQPIAIPLGHKTAITFEDPEMNREVSFGLTMAPRSDEGNQGDGTELQIFDVYGFEYGGWDFGPIEGEPTPSEKFNKIKTKNLDEVIKEEAAEDKKREQARNRVAVMLAKNQTQDSIRQNWTRVTNKPSGFTIDKIEGNLLYCTADVPIEIESLPDNQVLTK